jgi:mycothiol synthase
MTVRVHHFAGAITDGAIHEAYNAFDNEMLHEEDPTLAQRPVGDTGAMLTQSPSHERRPRWFVMDGTDVIGAATLYLDDEDSANLHVGWLDLGVLSGHRRRGLGTRLLSDVARHAQTVGRATLMPHTTSLIPAGGQFMRHLAAEPGLVEGVNELQMTDLDLKLMERWAAAGRAQSDRFELLRVDGSWPDEMIDEVVALYQVMNDAPVGDLDFNDQAFTADHITEWAAELAARSIARFVLAVRDLQSGRLAGYTELGVNPSFPDLGQQSDTGVFEEFRGHGLGKWLKAEMVLRLAAEHPEVTRIRTENAHSNAAMLAINHAMGFRLHHEQTIWQINVEELLVTLNT